MTGLKNWLLQNEFTRWTFNNLEKIKKVIKEFGTDIQSLGDDYVTSKTNNESLTLGFWLISTAYNCAFNYFIFNSVHPFFTATIIQLFFVLFLRNELIEIAWILLKVLVLWSYNTLMLMCVCILFALSKSQVSQRVKILCFILQWRLKVEGVFTLAYDKHQLIILFLKS